MSKQGCRCENYVNGRCIGEGECELQAKVKDLEGMKCCGNCENMKWDLSGNIVCRSSGKHRDEFLEVFNVCGDWKLSPKEFNMDAVDKAIAGLRT